MGGTSTDVSLVQDRQPGLTLNGRLGDWPVQLTMLDIATIGCGGGSIAEVSPYGSLTVGPASAGADPGPACYGRGSNMPTVTDANLALGRVSSSIAGGQLTLNTEAAVTAIRDAVASPLGMDVAAAASGILQIANNAMVGAIRNISVERGYDPREFALVAYGGAGPMHAIEVANLLGVTMVVVPPHPGIASAYGLLVAEFKNDYARTSLQQPPDYDLQGMAEIFDGLEREGQRWLEIEGVANSARMLSWSADLRYEHQGSELTIPYDGTRIDRPGLEGMIEEFHRRHSQLYGFSLDQPVEIVTLRVTASGHLGDVAMPTLPPGGSKTADAVVDERRAYFEETRDFVACPIYRRERLSPGASIVGPAILEGMDSTVVINPGWESRIDQYGNCIMRATGE